MSELATARDIAAPAPVRPPSTSMRLWGLDWRKVLPWRFEDGVTVEAGDFEAAVPFIRDHYAGIFGADDGRFLNSPMTPAKHKFLTDSDVLVLKDGTKTIGLFLCHPTDWATYYIRSASLLPEYRGREFMWRIMELIFEPLRAVGVERVESDVSPANRPVIEIHIAKGYQMTGTTNSERWGSLVRFTKFLSADAEDCFRRQFISAPPRARRGHNSERRQS